MRTVVPQNIRNDFKSAVADIRNTYSGVLGTSLIAASKNLVAEYSFLGAAILLEGFMSDLFIAYINNDNSQFVRYLLGKMSVQPEGEVANRAKSLANVQINSHLTVENIRSVIDPRDYNVSFATTADLNQKAGQWLANPFRGYFVGLSKPHCTILEATKAIRNFLAHRSKASKATMQSALAEASLPSGLGRGGNNVHNVGSFLNSKPVGSSSTRLNLYIVELEGIANQLCP